MQQNRDHGVAGSRARAGLGVTGNVAAIGGAEAEGGL